LDGTGEGQIFLRDLPPGIVGAKPEGNPIPTIMDVRMVVKSLRLSSDQVNEGQGGLEIL
jgi:hypothetical protein